MSCIKIKKYEASSIYNVENSESSMQYYNIGKAVLDDSLFLQYLLSNNKFSTKNDTTNDIILVAFNTTVKSEDGKKVILNREELRNLAYRDGVIIRKTIYEDKKIVGYSENGTRYVMLCRTPGKAKSGECLFIKEYLWKQTINFLSMGLYGKTDKLVELSAYQTLSMGSANEGYMNISLDNVFFAWDDEVASPNIEQITVVNDENGECSVRKDLSGDIKNVLHDGMGIIDESIFPDQCSEFVYLRNHFFKSCLFRGNIQQYYKDYFGAEYETAIVTDLFGRKMKASDVKVIVTENSIKWFGKFEQQMVGKEIKSEEKLRLAAFKKYQQYLEKYDNSFAIVKTAHPSKYGEIQRASYQIINSLPFDNNEQLYKTADISIDYLNKLKFDDKAFLEYLHITDDYYKVNDLVIDIAKINHDFCKTEWYKSFKSDSIRHLKKNLTEGKLFFHGDNLTLCGNPLSLIMKSVGLPYTTENCFSTAADYIECYTQRFEEGEYLAGFRSPHNSANNIVHYKNIHPSALKKYFPKLGKSVIIVNCIGTDIQDRLNGCDFDSDTNLVTNDAPVVELAKKAYIEYPTIKNNIGKSTRIYDETNAFAIMDSSIARSNVVTGESSNFAAKALSYISDTISNRELNLDVCVICSVLAQCSLDSSKRNFDIDIYSTLKSWEKKFKSANSDDEGKLFIPKTLGEILNKNNIKSEQTLYTRDFNCPLDIIRKYIEESSSTQSRNTSLPISEIIDSEELELISASKQSLTCSKIIKRVEQFDLEKPKMSQETKESFYEETLELYNELLNDIETKKLSPNDFYFLVKTAFNIKTAIDKTVRKMCKDANVSKDKIPRKSILLALSKVKKREILKIFEKKSSI